MNTKNNNKLKTAIIMLDTKDIFYFNHENVDSVLTDERMNRPHKMISSYYHIDAI